MIDDEKKKTACLFITLPERVEEKEYGEYYEYKDTGRRENAQKYFAKFGAHSVVPVNIEKRELEKQLSNLEKTCKSKGIEELQVIFDVHGTQEKIQVPKQLIEEIFERLEGFRRVDLLFANCNGNLNVDTGEGLVPLPQLIEGWYEGRDKALRNLDVFFGHTVDDQISRAPRVHHLYFMPEGKNCHVEFTPDGNIFFVSTTAKSNSSVTTDAQNNSMTEYYFTTDDPNEAAKLQTNYEGGGWKIPAVKLEQPNIVEGIYKDRPPRYYNINVDANKEASTAIVPYKQPNASTLKQIPEKNPKKNVTKKNKITYKKLDLNLKNTKNKKDTQIKK